MMILVTGASGHVGSCIFRYLKNKGHKVIGLSRTSDKNNEDIYCCDLKHEIPLDIHFDAIVHAAASKPTKMINLCDMYNDNVISTCMISKFARKNGINKIIYLGTVSSYGEVTGILNENSPRVNVSDYGMTKLLGERIIEKSGIDSYLLILPGVVGCGCDEVWIERLVEDMKRNKEITIYNPKGDFNNIVHIDDLCNYIECLIGRPCTEKKAKRLLLGCQKKIKIYRLVELIRMLTSSKSKIVYDYSLLGGFSINCMNAIDDGYISRDIDTIIKTVL